MTMFPYTKDYIWIKGIPYGTSEIDPSSKDLESVKVVYDSYQKHYSIERYRGTRFEGVIYDSALLDFSKLGLVQQQAWSKEILEEGENWMRCLIRDENDRVVASEHYAYENQRCRFCDSYSPHGPLLSRQQIHFQDLGDSFDGVILFDANEHPVMKKTYAVDDEGSFGKLLTEEWDMRKLPLPE